MRRWVVLAVSSQESAKADEDSSYVPKEHIAGYIEAEHEQAVLKKLKKAKEAGICDKSAQLKVSGD